jgi:hypothetical protein
VRAKPPLENPGAAQKTSGSRPAKWMVSFRLDGSTSLLTEESS